MNGRLGVAGFAGFVAASIAVLAGTIAQHGILNPKQSEPPPRLQFQWIVEPPPLAEPAARVAGARRPVWSAARLALESDRGPLRRLIPPASPRRAAPLQISRQDPAELRRAEQRLKDDLTRELYDNFKLFLYVNKAQRGPLAQRMYVFDKRRNGDLDLLYDWPVSTGREQTEPDATGEAVATHTPSGYYELDPARFYRNHRSGEWHESMPYSMFLNWIRNGRLTGLAIHAATGNDIADLGARASAGCIRLAPEDARTLFALIRGRYRGRAPRFAIDARTGTMNFDGVLLRDAKGRVKFADGYKVLVLIENYGGENMVAAMF